MRLFFLPFLPVALASTLLHRVYHPLEPIQQFVPRGVLSLDSSSPSLTPAETFQADLQLFAGSLTSLDGALYQVALEREGDHSEDQHSFSSVKAVRTPLPISPLPLSFPPQ
jgi:ER membrane protein complex subunit 10